MQILQLPSILMGGIGGANPGFVIKNDDKCVIFGRNKKFQPIKHTKWMELFISTYACLIVKR